MFPKLITIIFSSLMGIIYTFYTISVITGLIVSNSVKKSAENIAIWVVVTVIVLFIAATVAGAYYWGAG